MHQRATAYTSFLVNGFCCCCRTLPAWSQPINCSGREAGAGRAPQLYCWGSAGLLWELGCFLSDTPFGASSVARVALRGGGGGVGVGRFTLSKSHCCH